MAHPPTIPVNLRQSAIISAASWSSRRGRFALAHEVAVTPDRARGLCPQQETVVGGFVEYFAEGGADGGQSVFEVPANGGESIVRIPYSGMAWDTRSGSGSFDFTSLLRRSVSLRM